MTDNRLNTLFWAVALTLAGLLLLFYNFDMFAAYEPTAQYLLAGLLGAGGVGFFVAYLSTRPELVAANPSLDSAGPGRHDAPDHPAPGQ